MEKTKTETTDLQVTLDDILQTIATYEAYIHLCLKDPQGVAMQEHYHNGLPKKLHTILSMYIDAKHAKVMQVLAPVYMRGKEQGKA